MNQLPFSLSEKEDTHTTDGRIEGWIMVKYSVLDQEVRVAKTRKKSCNVKVERCRTRRSLGNGNFLRAEIAGVRGKGSRSP